MYTCVKSYLTLTVYLQIFVTFQYMPSNAREIIGWSEWVLYHDSYFQFINIAQLYSIAFIGTLNKQWEINISSALYINIYISESIAAHNCGNLSAISLSLSVSPSRNATEYHDKE